MRSDALCRKKGGGCAPRRSDLVLASMKSQKPDQVIHEPGMEERFQRALRKTLNTSPRHHTSRTPKAKERPASKGRVHKGKTRN
jgi:hypothetical protein